MCMDRATTTAAFSVAAYTSKNHIVLSLIKSLYFVSSSRIFTVNGSTGVKLTSSGIYKGLDILCWMGECTLD